MCQGYTSIFSVLFEKNICLFLGQIYTCTWFRESNLEGLLSEIVVFLLPLHHFAFHHRQSLSTLLVDSFIDFSL